MKQKTKEDARAKEKELTLLIDENVKEMQS